MQSAEQNRLVDRRILALALPALGALAVEPIYVIVDTAIVGRLGTPHLAGLAVAAAVLSFVFASANFLTYGTTQQSAGLIGAGDSVGAAEVGVQALWVAVLVGTPVAMLLVAFAEPLCQLLGADTASIVHAVSYLRWSAIGVPFFFVTLAAQGFLRGASDYLTPLWILVAANVANLGLELLLVYGFDLGVAGSAIGTVIAQIGAAMAFLWRVRPRLAIAVVRRPQRERIATLMTAGRHLLLRVGSMLVVFAGATAIAARISAATLAAHQIGYVIFFFTALVLDALAVPAQTIVAEDLGAQQRTSAAVVARRAVRLSIIVGLGMAVLMAIAAPMIPHLFSNDPDVISEARIALWFLAAMLVPGAIAFAHDGVLIGAGDYRFLGRAALAYLVAVLPLAAVVLLVPQLGIAGIWGALVLWMVLRAGVNDHRTRRLLAL